MMKNYIIIALFSFLSTVFLYGQDPQIEWQNTIGGEDNDVLYSVVQTLDGGYILGGESESNISGDKTENAVGYTDYWVVKIDASGNVEWEKTIGGLGHERLRSVFQASNGDYIIGGYSNSNIGGDKTEDSNGQSDYWVLRLDTFGNIIWQNTIGGNWSEELTSIIPTEDGGILIGGSSSSDISGDKTESSRGGPDYWIVKLNGEGEVQWDKTIGGFRDDILESIAQTADGGFILGGTSESDISGDKTENSKGGYDYWVVKTDALGNIEWQKTIGGDDVDELHAIAQNVDGGYILAGDSISNSSGDKSEDNIGYSDYWIVRLDQSGNIMWENTIGALSQNEVSSVIQTNDEGFLVGGWSGGDISGDKTENSRGGFDYWILKLYPSGQIEWQKTIGGGSPDLVRDVNQTSDGGFILAGHSHSNISGDKTEDSKGLADFWVVKLKGTLGINDIELSTSINVFPNPTENILQLNSHNHIIDGLKIFDTKGSLIKEFKNPENLSNINVSNLPAGVYFLRISSNEKTVIKKFVKI